MRFMSLWCAKNGKNTTENPPPKKHENFLLIPADHERFNLFVWAYTWHERDFYLCHKLLFNVFVAFDVGKKLFLFSHTSSWFPSSRGSFIRKQQHTKRTKKIHLIYVFIKIYLKKVFFVEFFNVFYKNIKARENWKMGGEGVFVNNGILRNKVGVLCTLLLLNNFSVKKFSFRSFNFRWMFNAVAFGRVFCWNFFNWVEIILSVCFF